MRRGRSDECDPARLTIDMERADLAIVAVHRIKVALRAVEGEVGRIDEAVDELEANPRQQLAAAWSLLPFVGSARTFLITHTVADLPLS